MKKIKQLTFLLVTLVLLSACSKDKKNANRIDGKSYKVSSISIDGANMTESMPTLNFEDCRIFKETCNGTWIKGSESAAFNWQFRDKGETFEISNQSQQATEATKEAIAFSGIYMVEENKKGNFRISSTNTIGHQGENVVITMTEM